MSEIEDIAKMEFNELYVNLGELDSELDIAESRTDRQDISEEMLGVDLAPTAEMPSMPRLAHRD